jgi:hypothetical protein
MNACAACTVPSALHVWELKTLAAGAAGAAGPELTLCACAVVHAFCDCARGLSICRVWVLGL